VTDLKFAHRANEIVSKAGKLLEKLSLDPLMRKPIKKEDGSPVTPADYKISEFLTHELKVFGFPVISEESLPPHQPSSDTSYFLVDPIDGTKYFARGENEFAICVGLIVAGEPIYGAIYDPNESKLYWALKAEGAFCNQLKIGHSGVKDKVKVYSSGFHKRPEKDFIVSKLNIGEILEKGSALKFCDIAKGDVDLYMRFGPISEWDTAAAQVILEEAGCDIFEAKTLTRMTYGKKNYLSQGVIACQKNLSQTVITFLQQYSPT
jgi:3'(2'), 5'-bisphosphate nucleotidase